MDCQLSVILCTYNPNRELLAKALAAVAAQSLARDRFELIVIDNNSSPALQEDDLAALSGGPVRLVRELRQGLTFARACGLKTASSERICFIDDDNEIAPDFFETALAIFWAEPRLGVFGGVAEGALGRSVGPLKTAFLPHLGVRDMGADDMTGSGAAWGPWEPIGAGLCLRAEVGEGYVAYVEGEGAAGGLGRQGGALLSGEDSLISRIAHCQGFLCGYRPKLRLRHHIGAGRLTYGYMARILHGHGRSHVLLERIVGESPPPVGSLAAILRTAFNFFHRLRKEGPRTAVGMVFWDRGYFAEVRRPIGAPVDRPLAEILDAAAPKR